ncbi:MAG: TM2 domain-containing protein [Faecalibacterium sp.]|nr:TM2 domain-containing protein [Ruminococcus sp.]MCM1391950.1 TM2 domain-containing protein [Ruminococcus sp.]MCM1484978.1 TM2 domain-containing protein [Faecalibacterium sp.]
MNQQKVDMYLTANGMCFPSAKIPVLKEKLLQLDDSQYITLLTTELRDPTTMLIFSVFFGVFGVDRFMMGEIGIGVLKLLTGGCLGVLTIVDWFNVYSKTREMNFEKIMSQF